MGKSGVYILQKVQGFQSYAYTRYKTNAICSEEASDEIQCIGKGWNFSRYCKNVHPWDNIPWYLMTHQPLCQKRSVTAWHCVCFLNFLSLLLFHIFVFNSARIKTKNAPPPIIFQIQVTITDKNAPLQTTSVDINVLVGPRPPQFYKDKYMGSIFETETTNQQYV